MIALEKMGICINIMVIVRELQSSKECGRGFICFRHSSTPRLSRLEIRRLLDIWNMWLVIGNHFIEISLMDCQKLPYSAMGVYFDFRSVV